MKSASEIAEKIHKVFCGCRKDVCCGMPDMIAEAIDAARKEAVEEDRDKRTADDLYRASYRRGLKDVAKIIDTLLKGPGAIPIEWEDCCEIVKKKISAKAREA